MEKAKKSPDSKINCKTSEDTQTLSKNESSTPEVKNLTKCTRFRLSREYELRICNCKHILRMTVGERHSVVNPQRWLCNVCFTTESVWACLSCPNVACGRYIHEHALNHYLETQHPLAIDVNELYVYCYACEEYVLNDNKSGDIKVLRETLQAIRYQNFTGTTRSGHTLRTATISADEDIQMRRRLQQQQLDRDDRNFTAIWHSRFVRQRKAFKYWLHYVRHKSEYKDEEPVSPNISPDESPVRMESIRLREFAVLDLKTEDEETVSSPSGSKDLLPCFNSCEASSANKVNSTDLSLEMDKVTALQEELTMEDTCKSTQSIIEIEIDTSDTVPNDHVQLDLSDQTTDNKFSADIPVKGHKSEIKTEKESNSSVGDKTESKKVKRKDSLVEATQNIDTAQSRPKRANAASRYHEIMHRLSSFVHIEPVKKRLKLTIPTPSAGRKTSVELEDRRRSARLIQRTCEKAKAAEKARKKKGTKKKGKTKKSYGKSTQKAQKGQKATRVTGSSKTSHRRIRTQSGLRSLYDSIPNKAVTSLIPGVTGLRNLGNTCYLNSIIQVLGHLQKFRLCLLALRDLDSIDEHHDSLTSPVATHSRMGRRSTMEMYENQTNVSRRMLRLQSGLNGGHDGSASSEKDSVLPSAQLPPSLSLCHELNDLYHIMWSGKWKLVSPCHFLSSVWQLIPSFRGYSQQDAQEFLCELLDKIVSELEWKRRRPQMLVSNGLATRISKVVHAVFEGKLHSMVKCLECGNISSTIEPFWDLSLEFPQRYHVNAYTWKNSNQGCTLSEMLEKFTEAEQLDGGCVYNCAKCNLTEQQVTDRCNRRRRLSSRKITQKLTEAEKQIKISKLPQILRFHLKRFRWSGRNHREKITVPVNFPSEFDIRQHCWFDHQSNVSAPSSSDGNFVYDLSAVVIHHGRGFGSGHYTAYCWNDIGKFWVHCNDSNLELCSIDDVMAAQAYILFYSQRGLDPHPHFSAPCTPDMSPPISPTDSEVFDSDIG
ncbi:zinc finger protein 3 [Ciona intestinalis]